MAGAVAISGQITGIPGGTIQVGPFTLTPNSSNLYEELVVTLAANTSFSASWASYVLVIPPAANSTAIVLKGATGDTGVNISPNTPTLLACPSGGASFLLYVGSTVNNVTVIYF